MKIVLFVEGHTEKLALPSFFKRWLDPQLPQPIGIKTVRFEGWRDYYDEIGKKVSLNLSGKAGADVVGAIGSREAGAQLQEGHRWGQPVREARPRRGAGQVPVVEASARRHAVARARDPDIAGKLRLDLVEPLGLLLQ